MLLKSVNYQGGAGQLSIVHVLSHNLFSRWGVILSPPFHNISLGSRAYLAVLIFSTVTYEIIRVPY